MSDQRELLLQIESLRREVAELRQARHREIPIAPASPLPAPAYSRRSLLKAAPVVAAAGVGVGLSGLASSAPAAAAPGEPVLLGASNDASGTPTTLLGSFGLLRSHVDRDVAGLQVLYRLRDRSGDTEFSTGGTFKAGSGEVPNPMVAIEGVVRPETLGAFGNDGLSVSATWPGNAIVATLNDTTLGRRRDDGVDACAVKATAVGEYTAISATSTVGPAFRAQQTSTGTRTAAADVSTAGRGPALDVRQTNIEVTDAATSVTTAGRGAALYAVQGNATATAAAVTGRAGARGRGGSFGGGAAAVTLLPSAAATHPTTGRAGDLTVDSSNRLWFCKGGTAWSQLA